MEHRTTPAEITVASLNLHCGVGSNGQPYDVEAAIRGLDAQVIALQETWSAESGPDPVAAAADALGARLLRVPLSPVTTLRALRIPGFAGPGRFGMAVLSTLPVTGYEVSSLSQVPGDLVRRCAQILTIELPGGSAIRLAGTHLTYRFASLGQLWQLIRRLGSSSAVIAGDLNMPRLIAGTTPGYSPAVQGRTWPAELPIMQLDHVLISRDIERIDGAVLPAAGSDHLPIRARVSAEGKPAATAQPRPGRPRRSAPAG